MSEQRIAISTRNLLLIIATGLLGVLLWQLRSLLLVLMIAIVLAATLAPIIDRAEKLRVPRLLAVLLAYLGLGAGLTGMGLLIGPTVSQQTQRLIQQLPTYLDIVRSLLENVAIRMGLTDPETLSPISQLFDTQALTNWLIRSSQQLLLRSYDVTRGILSGLFTLIVAVLISGYMLSGSEQLIRGLVRLFPKPWDERLAAQVKPVSRRMGGYIQGRVLVSAILALVIAVGVSILGLSDFALALGAIAGLTNLIPFFGPVLGAVPALIVAIGNGGWTFLWVLLLFVIIQNLETYVLDPLLVGNSVRVHPLYQLLAVLGGTQVLGIVGAIIVPPWIAGAAVVLENLYLRPKGIAEQRAEQQKAAIAPTSDSKNTYRDVGAGELA